MPRRRKSRPKALDLFCGAGGASMGLHQAGFDVTGIDLLANKKTGQPADPARVKGTGSRYPFRLIVADALDPPVNLADFDFIWASPPCQHYTNVWLGTPEKRDNYPDLLPATRALLAASGRPFAIENVPGAPMRADVVLSGAMFGLDIIRKRLFECEGFRPPFALEQEHFGKTVSNGDLATVAGQGANNAWNVGRIGEKRTGKATKWRDLPEDLKDRLRTRNNAEGWRAAMDIDWMTRDEIREAVPPAYARFIAEAVIEQI